MLAMPYRQGQALRLTKWTPLIKECTEMTSLGIELRDNNLH